MKKVLRYFNIFFLLYALTLSAVIHHVYESNGAQAIQDSIDISEVYDTIMIHNGKYYIGDLLDTLGINLKGRQLMSVSPDSAPYCILTALSSSGLDTSKHVIWDTLLYHECYSLIQGFTITKGKGFKNVSAGGGIYIANWDMDFLYLEIQDNIITENSGGITIDWSDNVIIQRNQILNNEGFGIGCLGTGSINIKDNVIKGNKNYYDGGYQDGIGGGIFLESGLGKGEYKEFDQKDKQNGKKIENNIIINNYAEHGGGGIGLGFHIKAEINRNLIAFNEAGKAGGGIFSKGGSLGISQINGSYNIIIDNKAVLHGAFLINVEDTASIYRLFVVDNGSFSNNSSSIKCSGGVYFELKHSNIYYNNYQKDIEVTTKTITNTTNLENNFWWVTDSAEIDSLIEGDADFIPFELGPVPDAPGEPVEIYSVLNYSSDYLSIIDSIGRDPDTLYLEITGHDNKNEFQEAAVAILKSKIYPDGIAVALLETDKSTGIYRGKAIVKTTNPPDSIRIDDIYQIIRVHPDADTIRVYANMDTTEMFKVYYRCQSGIEEDLEDEIYIESLQNPLTYNPEFRFYLPVDTRVELTIYDISGRVIDEVLSKELSSGWHTVKVDIKKAGVYIYRMSSPFGEKNGKIVVIK
jgi:hypothetical protein